MTSGFDSTAGWSNEELLCRCKDNDESALRELLRRHERPVYSLLYRMLGCHEDAEDALADVFVKVWRSAAGFRGASKFTTWLYQIAGNTARDALRSRKARPEVAVDDVMLSEIAIQQPQGSCFGEYDSSAVADPEKALITAEENAILDAAIQKLSEEDRMIVVLYHIQECSLEEIAEITGQNKNNLKVRLFRARQRLHKHLEHFDRETDDGVQRSTTESFGLASGAAPSD